MSEKSEICQLVVTNAGEFGDEEFQFTFQAVDGEVLLGCNVRAYVAGEIKRREEDPVALTVYEARRFVRLLMDMVYEANEQKEKFTTGSQT